MKRNMTATTTPHAHSGPGERRARGGSAHPIFRPDFVKIERLAVLQRFRGSRIAAAVIEHALGLVRPQGLPHRLWPRAEAGCTFPGAASASSRWRRTQRSWFSDHEYIEMIASLAPHHDRLTIHSDPYMLIRPEGRWDEEGVLERSAVRAATNPR